MESDLQSDRERVEQLRTLTAHNISATRRIVRRSTEMIEECRRRQQDEREAAMKSADRLGRSSAP